jgi:hypothetical protein
VGLVAIDDELIGIVDVVLADPPRSRLVAHQRAELLRVKLLQQGQNRVAHVLLLFFAGDADARPRNRVQPRRRDRFAAVAADAIGAFVDPGQGLFDRLQNFGVGLFQLS